MSIQKKFCFSWCAYMVRARKLDVAVVMFRGLHIPVLNSYRIFFVLALSSKPQ